MHRLHDFDLIYLATPYSKYPLGIEQAFIDACKLAGELLCFGVKVYSPIAHTHPIAIHAGIDPLDHSIWLPFDHSIMKKSDALLIARMESWDRSFGIAEEIKFFKSEGKPIFYLWPASLEVESFESLA